MLVTLFSTKSKFEEKKEEIVLNERQRKAVAYLKENKKITKDIYKSLNNISNATAKRDIKDLVDKKILKQTGKGPSVYYVLRL